MKLISKFGTFEAVRIKHTPKFIRHGAFELLDITINDEKHQILVNPCKDFEHSHTIGTVYLNYNSEWWMLPKFQNQGELGFRLEGYKSKQVRKARKKTVVPFQFSHGKDADVVDENDCTVRAFSLGFDVPYTQAFKLLESAGRKQGKRFVTSSLLVTGFKLGSYTTRQWEYSKIKELNLTVNSFIKAYPIGRYILTTKSHAFTILDGVVHDTYTKPRAKVTKVWELYHVDE